MSQSKPSHHVGSDYHTILQLHDFDCSIVNVPPTSIVSERAELSILTLPLQNGCHGSRLGSARFDAIIRTVAGRAAFVVSPTLLISSFCEAAATPRRSVLYNPLPFAAMWAITPRWLESRAKKKMSFL